MKIVSPGLGAGTFFFIGGYDGSIRAIFTVVLFWNGLQVWVDRVLYHRVAYYACRALREWSRVSMRSATRSVCVCMCVCVYIYIYTCMCMCVFVCTRGCVCELRRVRGTVLLIMSVNEPKIHIMYHVSSRSPCNSHRWEENVSFPRWKLCVREFVCVRLCVFVCLRECVCVSVNVCLCMFVCVYCIGTPPQREQL